VINGPQVLLSTGPHLVSKIKELSPYFCYFFAQVFLVLPAPLPAVTEI
jgi:hypothetical protein